MRTLVLVLLSLYFVQCSSGAEGGDTDECIELQEKLNIATDKKLTTFGEYLQDKNDPEKCTAYAEALTERIAAAQAMIDNDCLFLGSLNMTEQAMDEDRAELNRIGC